MPTGKGYHAQSQNPLCLPVPFTPPLPPYHPSIPHCFWGSHQGTLTGSSHPFFHSGPPSDSGSACHHLLPCSDLLWSSALTSPSSPAFSCPPPQHPSEDPLITAPTCPKTSGSFLSPVGRSPSVAQGPQTLEPCLFLQGGPSMSSWLLPPLSPDLLCAVPPPCLCRA